MLSDLWSPIEDIRATLTQLSSNGSQGHLVQIVDPAEETFPYSGRIEFTEPEGAGEITAGRAENWRADYEARLRRHRDEIRAEAAKLGWSFTIHRTDRPANELLMALHARIGEGNDAAISNRRLAGTAPRGRHDVLPARYSPRRGCCSAWLRCPSCGGSCGSFRRGRGASNSSPRSLLLVLTSSRTKTRRRAHRGG